MANVASLLLTDRLYIYRYLSAHLSSCSHYGVLSRQRNVKQASWKRVSIQRSGGTAF